MASMNSDKVLELIEQSHPVWSGHFAPDERRQMLKDDATTWSMVSLELVSIVSVGFILMALTVVAVLLSSR